MSDIEDLLVHLLDPEAEPARHVRHQRPSRSAEEEAMRLEDGRKAYKAAGPKTRLEVGYFAPTGQLLVELIRPGVKPSRSVIGDTLADCIRLLASRPDDGGYPVVLNEDGDEVCCVCHGLAVKFDELDDDEDSDMSDDDDAVVVVSPGRLRGVVGMCRECGGSGVP